MQELLEQVQNVGRWDMLWQDKLQKLLDLSMFHYLLHQNHRNGVCSVYWHGCTQDSHETWRTAHTIRIQLKMNFLSLNQENKLTKITPLRTCKHVILKSNGQRNTCSRNSAILKITPSNQSNHQKSYLFLQQKQARQLIQNQQEWRRLYTLHSTEAQQ